MNYPPPFPHHPPQCVYQWVCVCVPSPQITDIISSLPLVYYDPIAMGMYLYNTYIHTYIYITPLISLVQSYYCYSMNNNAKNYAIVPKCLRWQLFCWYLLVHVAFKLHWGNINVTAFKLTALLTVCPTACSGLQQRKHQSFGLLSLSDWNLLLISGFPSQRASNPQIITMSWCHQDITEWYYSFIFLCFCAPERQGDWRHNSTNHCRWWWRAIIPFRRQCHPFCWWICVHRHGH